jgi:hypothetical protein
MTASLPTCPTCGAGAPQAFTAFDRNQRVSSKRFPYHRCRGCGTLFLAHVPDDLAVYYPSSYYPPLPRPGELDRAAQSQSWRLDIIRKYAASGRLVEVGPGPGLFLYLAKTAGFAVTAIEMDARCCRYLEDIVGVDVIPSGRPADALGRLHNIVVITFWHALEHLSDPWECLVAAAEAAAPGGVVLVSMPNLDSIQFRLMRSRWPHVDAPRHLVLIPPQTLCDRAAGLGLDVVELTSADPGGEHFNGFGWQGLLPRRGRGRVSYLAGRALAVIASPIETRGLTGSTYTAVLRKSGTGVNMSASSADPTATVASRTGTAAAPRAAIGPRSDRPFG